MVDFDGIVEVIDFPQQIFATAVRKCRIFFILPCNLFLQNDDLGLVLFMFLQDLLFELREVLLNFPLAAIRDLFIVHQFFEQGVELAISLFLVFSDVRSVSEQPFFQFLQPFNQLGVFSNNLALVG